MAEKTSTHSRSPRSWDEFFALRDAGVEEAADFLIDRYDPPAQPREAALGRAHFPTSARANRPGD